MKINTNLASAPYDTQILLWFPGPLLHTGMKIKKESMRYPNTKREVRFFEDDYIPIGIEATYGEEPYFSEEPIGWSEFELTMEIGGN